MTQDIYETRYDLGKVISTGWEQYRQNFQSILRIFLIVYIPINILLSFIPVDYLIDQQGFDGIKLYARIAELMEFIIGVLATMSLAKLVEASLNGQQITWQQALQHALSRWGASIITGLLAGLIILGMTLLLVVPGIIWSLYYSLFVFVVALRGLSGKDALYYSKAIVQGQWWRVFGYLIVIEVLSYAAGFTVSFLFTVVSGNSVFGIAVDTLLNIVSALFLTMTTIFFLNNDQYRVKSESADLPSSEPTLTPPQE